MPALTSSWLQWANLTTCELCNLLTSAPPSSPSRTPSVLPCERLAAAEHLPFVRRLRQRLHALAPLLSINLIGLSGAVALEAHSCIWGFQCVFFMCFSLVIAFLSQAKAERPPFGLRLPECSLMASFVVIRIITTGLATLHVYTDPAKETDVSRQVNTFYSFWKVHIGILWAVLPCPDHRRYEFLWALVACTASDSVRHAYLLDSSALLFMLRGPVALLCGAVVMHVTSTAALSFSVEREAAMGDLRLALDHDAEIGDLVDTNAVQKAWTDGPLTRLNGLVAVCSTAVICADAAAWHSAEDRSLLRNAVVAGLFIVGPVLLPRNRERKLDCIAQQFKYGTAIAVAMRLTLAVYDIYAAVHSPTSARGHDANGLFGAPAIATSAAMLAAEADATRRLGMLPQIMIGAATPVAEFLRASFVGTMPCAHRRRQHASLLLVLSVLLREVRRVMYSVEKASLTITIFSVLQAPVMTLLALAMVHFSVNEAYAAFWQRERMMVEIEVNRHKQLRQMTAEKLRKSIASEKANAPESNNEQPEPAPLRRASGVAIDGSSSCCSSPSEIDSGSPNQLSRLLSRHRMLTAGGAGSRLVPRFRVSPYFTQRLSSSESQASHGSGRSGRFCPPAYSHGSGRAGRFGPAAYVTRLADARGLWLSSDRRGRRGNLLSSIAGSCAQFASKMSIIDDEEVKEVDKPRVTVIPLLRGREGWAIKEKPNWLTESLFHPDLIESVLLYLAIALASSLHFATAEAFG